MKKFILFILVICTCLFITGCSYEPTYYSRDEVIEYVSKIFGDNYTLQEINTIILEDEKNPSYEYIFKENKMTFTFSVTTYTYNVTIDASTTNFYDKGISDNYIDKKIEKYSKEIDNYLKEASFDTKRTEYTTYLYLDSYTQIAEATNLIYKIDKLVKLEYNYKNWQETYPNDRYSISIYLKPTQNYTDISTWQENYNYKITEVNLSNSNSTRLNEYELVEDIEYALVNKVKTSSTQYYQLPQILLTKYPSSKITIDKINNIPVTDYSLSYDKATSQYWIYTLDPCQDSPDFPYNYTNKGTFKSLIELLGGNYTSSNLEAEYTLGNDTFKMKLILNDDNEYQNLQVTKNNQEIILSNSSNKLNGTVSGRAYTKEDLERLLNVKIIIDQTTSSAIMYSV